MHPVLGINSPASRLRNVDLPAPFEPMTVTNSPAAIDKFTPCKARFSSIVPLLNVTPIFSTLIISAAPRMRHFARVARTRWRLDAGQLVVDHAREPGQRLRAGAKPSRIFAVLMPMSFSRLAFSFGSPAASSRSGIVSVRIGANSVLSAK